METGKGDQDSDVRFEFRKDFKDHGLLQDFKEDVQAVINSTIPLVPPPQLTNGDKLGDNNEIIDNLSKRRKRNNTPVEEVCQPFSSTSATISNSDLTSEAICHKVWTKFSNKHKKSPSHINNNIQSCMKSKAETNQTHTSTPTESISGLGGSDEDLCTGCSNLDKESSGNDKNTTTWVLLLFDSFQRIFRVSQVLFKAVGLILIALILLYGLITFHKPTQAFIARHTQDLIYPFMRALRILSLPIIRRLPLLTDLYEEPCLFSNPFYAIDDLDCWPCESVRHVIDLTGFSNFSSAYHHSGIPFIVKDAFKTELEIEDIRKIYSENQDLLGKTFVESNRLGLTTVENLFSPTTQALFETDDFHVEWNINRVTTARLWRKYFPKPYFVPDTTEVSVQHFMFIDQVSAQPYRLPLTEFANVFLTQTSGSRSIVLIPTESCHSRCKVVSAVLQPKDVLFYNWLFWRPMSVPADSSTLRTMAITYVGSFY